MRDYQRKWTQKLSDANLESMLWNKVRVKLQKEVGQMTAVADPEICKGGFHI